MRMHAFPTLIRALILMARDNGVINRRTTSDDVILRASALLTDTDEQLVHAEDELLKLSFDDLDTVCTGDQDDPVVLALSETTTNVLHHMFDTL